MRGVRVGEHTDRKKKRRKEQRLEVNLLFDVVGKLKQG